jgi:RNA polymerase sigma-70 factor (ECF subfamily)
MLERFLAAASTHDAAALVPLLKEDVVLYSDGGGIVAAALKPIYGADKVARFTAGVIRKFAAGMEFSIAPTELNGAPGFIFHAGTELHSVLTVEVDGDQISAVYLVRNPQKLRRIA